MAGWLPLVLGSGGGSPSRPCLAQAMLNLSQIQGTMDRCLVTEGLILEALRARALHVSSADC